MNSLETKIATQYSQGQCRLALMLTNPTPKRYFFIPSKDFKSFEVVYSGTKWEDE